MANQDQTPNRLVGESSPYLLLHAHNPVDWYPWGRAALDRARQENKPIFLSVGYSSCHWCHVMARESFLDEEIAAVLKQAFISIKVDREERPDIDSIYMAALQIMTRQGGWPMSMFLTPDTRPFYGATYLPARDGDRPGALGLLTVLRRIQEIWVQDPTRVDQQADQIVAYVGAQLEQVGGHADTSVTDTLLARTHTALVQNFDEQWGGFGYNPANPRQPKFPEPANLLYLIARLRQNDAAPGQRARDRRMLLTTVDRMAAGGMRDHLGGGFHRYSVDRYWAVPHFEKMLYDNGQLAAVYSAAYELTQDPLYRAVVDELVGFVLREMTHAEGAFYSALDAESEGEEGKYYRWERAEIRAALAVDDYPIFAAAYGLDQRPNLDGRYHVLQRALSPDQLAIRFEQTPHDVELRLAAVRQRLRAIRDQRPRPRTDDKVLAAWNGLMIRGLADAGRILERPDYIAAAEKAARFILEQLMDENGRMVRVYGHGRTKSRAFLTDYAFLVNGLVALHRATGDDYWVRQAAQLTETQIEWYWDSSRGAFFFTARDHEPLLVRIKNLIDGAQPSGNSVSVENLLYLGRALPNPDFTKKAERTIAAATPLLERAPTAAMWLVAAVTGPG